jgi:hypothetical protein
VNKSLGVSLGIVTALLSTMCATSQTLAVPQKVDYCQVIASPDNYNMKVLSVEVVLSPNEHSLALYGASCVPRQGFDVTTEAVLPTAWETMPYGKRLRDVLRRQRPATVKLVGTFESKGGPYGSNEARFRFTISQVNFDRSHAEPLGSESATPAAIGAPVHELGHVDPTSRN